MLDDPFAAFGGHETNPVSAPVSQQNTPDPFAAFGGKADSSSSPQSQAPVPIVSTPDSDPFSAYGGRSFSSPNNGQPEPATPTKHLYQDDSQPWYKRAGDWLNTPLTESLFGLPEERQGAGGFERGLEHIASGLTSPLSLALTLATFGTGGLVESAGMTALKESGEFTAEELPQIMKAAKTAVDAYKAAPEGATAIADAVKAAGVDPALWNRAQSFLYDNGMSEHDLISGNLLEHGAFQVLHKVVPDLPVSATVRAAKTANTLLNAGFTLQQLESASAMSPRFLDALKEGDYDKAAEYGTEVFASGALGILGTTHALHAAGELFKPLIENDSFRPNDEWLAIDRANKEREAQHAVAEQEAINIDRSAREILGHADPGFLETVFGGSKEVKAQKDLELATVFHQIVTGGDRTKAAEWYNALSEALDRDERLPLPKESGPNNGQSGESSGGQINVESAPGSEFKEGLPGYEKLSRPEKESYHEEKMKVVEDALREAGFSVLGRDTGHGYWNDVSNPVSGFHVAGGPDITESAAKLVHQVLGDQTSIGYTVPHGPAWPTIGNETEFNLGHPLTPEEVRAVGRNLESAGISAYPEASNPQRLRIINYANEQENESYHGEITKLVQEALPNEKLSPIINRTTSNLVEQGTPSPIADKARNVIEGLNRKYGLTSESAPQIGQPIEKPSRANTKVMHSNDSGELRVGSDGRPVVWFNPKAWDDIIKIVSPDNPNFNGFSFDARDAAGLEKALPENSEAGDLISKARRLSKQNLLTTSKSGQEPAVRVVSEELHHTVQRELSPEGELENHLSPEQWTHLGAIIPKAWSSHLDSLGYSKDPVIRVLETAAQFMSKRHLDVPGIVSQADADAFISNYHNAVEQKHGTGTAKAFDNINEIAKQHVEDITNERNKRQSVVRGSHAGDSGPGDARVVPPLSRRLEEGRPSGDIEGGSRGTRGSTQGEGSQEDFSGGLASREEEQEFGKLSKLRLRGGMGDPGSAGLVTGDNKVLVGRDHDDLAKEAGYKEPANGKGNIHDAFFRDGGVRIRGAGGTVHIDFMEPNADTWDRVYRALDSVPSANRYYVDFRPLKDARATGFNIDAYDKDDLLYRLKDLESGREHPVAPGSVAYFRNGMFSREGDFRDKEPRFPGLSANGSRTWEEIKPFLNEEITKHDTPEKQEALTSAFNSLPDHQDYVEAIRAGRAGQMWYERSSRAFDALMDAGIDSLTKKDKPKFLNFVAALSPVQTVRSNLLMALNLWGTWDKAGRPTDVEWKDGVANKNSTLYRILKGRGNTQGVDLPARMNNAIRALQGEPLSGPKVSAFTTNLGKDVNRVTNDTWMAVFGGHDPNRINKPAVYDAMSAKVREAAQATGIAPRQAQAAVWSFIKSLAELSGWGNDRWIPPQEIIRQGLLTPELVGMHSADFADLIQNDPEIRDAIKAIGGDLNVLDRKLKTYAPGKPSEGGPAEPNPQLLNAAERLESARRDAKVAGHLARKQEPGLFDTEFRPNNGLFSRDPQLSHQIETNVFKNQPKDYQELVLESLRRNAVGELSDREIAAAKRLREEDGKNYQIGASNDLIHSFLENHLHRIYEDSNSKGKVILSNAKAGKFATNVTQARQQVFDSQLTALLKSPRKIMLDPVKAVSLDRESLIKAAANRQLIDNLRDKFTRASDGRPAVVLSGSGQVIAGQNGEDPSIFVDPNRVRKINIDPKVIQQLSTSGDLQRYLENGTIRDITPYVRPNNIGAAIDRLQEQTTRSTPIPDEHGQNPLQTKIMLLKSMQANNDFSGLKAFNDALDKKYAWDPQDYVSLANNSMKGWNFITNSPDGTPVYVRSDIKVHPEFADYLKNRLGLEQSDIAKNPVGKALLGAGTKLKHTLLSLSPFHMVQEALRGIMVGINPFHITGPDILSGERIDPSDPNSPTIIRKAVENGFTTGTDYKSLQAHSEGLSSSGGILNRIPGVGKVIGNSLNWYQDFLFKRYIPALKARGVELMFNEYRRLHPDWSVDRIAKAAATHTNDTFGGINWQAMGRSATTQDWGRLMLLAPDWLESEMRSGARLFNKDEGGLGRAQVAKMALGLWGIARVLNLVTTGNAHLEAPFGLAVKNKEGKETVFSIRTLPTDLLHAASDPVGFIKGRLSPTVRTGEELVSGRDQYGRKLQPSDLFVDIFRNMSPIPLQSVGQAISGTGPEVGNVGQTVKALGGTAQTYRTPAQKMAADLASSHSEDGPVDPSQMARHHRIMQIEDQARAGEISWPDLYRLTYATDQLHPDELKKIEMNVKDTKGMDPGMASLYSRAARLPAKDYLSLLDVMNNSERAALAPLTLKVQKRYLNKAKKDETPEERAKDPVFRRFLNMIPGHNPGAVSQASPPVPAPIQQEVSYLYRATHPDTGHRIGSNNGTDWFDASTGESIPA